MEMQTHEAYMQECKSKQEEQQLSRQMRLAFAEQTMRMNIKKFAFENRREAAKMKAIEDAGFETEDGGWTQGYVW